jgi:hypothetical protein
MHEFFKHIFGDYSFFQLLSFGWFFIIGYVTYGLTEATGRDVKSKNTPVEWSWKFWLKDNRRRYLTTILCTYVLFMFYDKFSGHPFGDFDALTLGLLGDGIAATLKKRVGLIAGNREKLMEEYKDEERG